MLALFIALRVGLEQPAWALTTAYITSQPLAGAVLSKAFFRVLGTALGATAAVVLVPAFVNEPIVLSCAIASWLGLCVYLAQLDRTPRSYVFLLAGYTASIIGFPNVLAPGSIFDVAALRVQEISIGIACAALVHGAVFPRTVAARLRARTAAIVADVEGWSRRSLAGRDDATLDRDRRRLAADVDELATLAVHLPFDTAREQPATAVVRALADQLGWLLPLQTAVEDRVAALRESMGTLPTDAAALVARTDAWLADDVRGDARNAEAHHLVARAMRDEAALVASRPADAGPWPWPALLHLSLLARIGELVARHQVVRELQDLMVGGERAAGGAHPSPVVAAEIAAYRGRALHRDHGLALRSGLGAALAVIATCLFWIFTAWPSGANAALIAGVGCALFGALPAATAALHRFLVGAIAGVLAAAVLDYAVLPRATDFAMLVACLAPPLLVVGSLMSRPALALVGMGAMIALVNTVGIGPVYEGDFAAFVNGALGLLAGIWAAIVVVATFQSVGRDVAIARIQRAGLRDIASRADGRARHTARWTSRMLDRAAQVALRGGPGAQAFDVLAGMRIGFLAGELHRLADTVADGAARGPLSTALAGIADHFRHLDPRHPAPVGAPVREAIDASLAAFARDLQDARKREGLVLLTGLRRTLFPAETPVPKEAR